MVISVLSSISVFLLWQFLDRGYYWPLSQIATHNEQDTERSHRTLRAAIFTMPFCYLPKTTGYSKFLIHLQLPDDVCPQLFSLLDYRTMSSVNRVFENCPVRVNLKKLRTAIFYHLLELLSSPFLNNFSYKFIKFT